MKMKGFDGKGSGRRGGALVLALIAVMGVSVMAATFLQASSQVTKRQQAAVQEKQAFYIAEAGLAEAYAGMMIGKTGNVGSSLTPALFGNGLFWVEAEVLSPDVTQLTSYGLAGGSRARLSYTVTTGTVGIASLGMFSSSSLNVPRGVTIDGYDSSLGAYGGQLKDAPQREATIAMVGETVDPIQYGGMGLLSTNGDITIDSTSTRPTKVFGILAPGPQGQVTYTGDPTVYGVVEPMTQTVVLPPVSVPPIPTQGGIDYSAGTPLLVQGAQLSYDHLSVTSGAEVVVEGPIVLVLGSLSLLESSSLRFDTTDGPIELFVTGDVELAGGTTVSTSSQDPSQLTVRVTEPALVQLHATAAFHGFLYAPEADVDVTRTFEVFGGVVADNLQLGPGSRLHFDQNLAVTANEEAFPLQLSWRLLGLESGAVGGRGGDPLWILGITSADLLEPSLAHADQVLNITYQDLAGVTQTFSGMESTFDWANVKQVYDVTRDGDLVVDPSVRDTFDTTTRTFSYSPI